jgi:hypothetical protein
MVVVFDIAGVDGVHLNAVHSLGHKAVLAAVP